MRSRVVETHVSTLLFVDDLVYKRKKPLDLGFSDFRDLSARRRACEEEVRLNRRLSPDVYEGVATLLGPDGEEREALVVMRRLPSERRLSALVRRGADVDTALRSVAQQLVRLHAGNRIIGPLLEHASARSLARLVEEALDVLSSPPSPLPGSVVDEVRRLARAWLDCHVPLLEARVNDGRVVDGHGDLLADDIFVLDDGVRVLDCLEFDEALRVVDGVHDAASLVMDLERLGRPDLSTSFLQQYLDLAEDDAPRALVGFFSAYRALVRAKVACLRTAQGDPTAATEVLLLAALARDQLRAATPRLVLVGGLPGSGKTTVAAAVAARRGFRHLSSDALRLTVSVEDQDKYSREGRATVYRELLGEAREALRNGSSVVLDATFTDPVWRSQARALGRALGAYVVELECTAAEDLALARLRRRTSGPSEATPLVRVALAERWQPWPEATTVDCSGAAGPAVAQALRLVP